MYKVLEIEKGWVDTCFTLENEKTGTKIECMEFDSYKDLKSFHFMKEGGIYDCLIKIDAEIIEEKEWENDDYYEILELNIRVGWCKFAKLKLNEDIYYMDMDDLIQINNLEKKKHILLRTVHYHLLKANDSINEAYYISEDKKAKLPMLIETAKQEGNRVKLEYYTMIKDGLEN